MKNICTLLMVIFFSSCNGLNKTQDPHANRKPSEQSDNLEVNTVTPVKKKSNAVKGSAIKGKEVPNGPRGIIRSIMKDQSGNLWFSSFEGAFRYDGKSFIRISDQEGLNYSRVFTTMQTRSGNMWFGTVSGVDAFIANRFDVPGVLKFYLDPRAVIRPYLGFDYPDYNEIDMFKEDMGLARNIVADMLEDRNGVLWFATEFGIGRYDGEKFIRNTPINGLANNSVNSILEDRAGNIWFGMEGGLCMFNGKTFSVMGDKAEPEFQKVCGLIEDKQGVIWFSTDNGVFQYDGKVFKNFSKESSLKNIYVENIFEDKSGNIWFGFRSVKNADPGAAYYDGKSFTYYSTKDGLNDNTIFSIMEDNEGNMWFGTRNGVCRYDGKTFVRFSMDGC